jgi:hypothetical protein
MGGQQLLEWAIEEPELFEAIFPTGNKCISFCPGALLLTRPKDLPLNPIAAGVKNKKSRELKA